MTLILPICVIPVNSNMHLCRPNIITILNNIMIFTIILYDILSSNTSNSITWIPDVNRSTLIKIIKINLKCFNEIKFADDVNSFDFITLAYKLYNLYYTANSGIYRYIWAIMIDLNIQSK